MQRRMIDFARCLSECSNLQLFELCKEFEDLSLDEKTDVGESSSVSSSSTNQVQQPLSYGSCITRFLRSLSHQSPWIHSITEQLRAPFIEYPRSYMDSFNLCDLTMGIGFRFIPGQSEFLSHDLKLPESFDRLSFISNALGFSYTSISPFSELMLPYCCSGAGLRSIINDNSLNQILVEVVTYCDGCYGRFIVLVCMGVGSTVWYGFMPGIANSQPEGGVFTPFNTYDQFLNSHYSAPEGFRKISFLERYDIGELVENTIGNEQPFAEIMIPANGNVLKSVGLGVMISFFIAVGIVPHATNSINNI